MEKSLNQTSAELNFVMDSLRAGEDKRRQMFNEHTFGNELITSFQNKEREDGDEIEDQKNTNQIQIGLIRPTVEEGQVSITNKRSGEIEQSEVHLIPKLNVEDLYNIQSEKIVQSVTINFNKNNKLLLESPKRLSNNLFEQQVNVQSVLQKDNADIILQQYPQGHKISNNPHVLSKNLIWQKKALVILFFIKKFLMNLKNYSSNQRFNQLQEAQFKIIDDCTVECKMYTKRYINVNQVVKNIFRFWHNQLFFWIKDTTFIHYLKLIKNRYFHVLLPDSQMRVMWDLIIALILMITVFYIPFKFSFVQSDDSDNDMNPMLFIMIDVHIRLLLLFDMVLNFFTAYYKKGMINREIKQIFVHYAKGFLLFDLGTILPFFLNIWIKITYIDILILLHYFRIVSTLTRILKYLTIKKQHLAIYDLFKLILLILFVAHICACGFHLLASYERSIGVNSWLDKCIVKDTQTEKYVVSLYWAVITMITVGYGDISAVTFYERLFIIVITFLACGVFAYSINLIGTIIQNIGNVNMQFEDRMRVLSTYMKNRGLNAELQMRVKKYFEYLHDEQQEDNEEGQLQLASLSGSLKNEVSEDIYCRILLSKKIFYLNFSKPFLKKLSLKMKEKRIGPEELIFNCHENLDSLFIVMRGDVDLFLPIHKQQELQKTDITDSNNLNLLGKLIRTVRKGEIFGETEFFTDRQTKWSAVSQNVVSLVYILKKDFLEVVQNFPLDFEKYCVIRDNYNLYGSTQGLAVRCPSCLMYSHDLLNCPFVCFTSCRDTILAKYRQQDQNNERGKFQRSNLKFQNTLASIDLLKESAIQYIIESLDETEDYDSVMQQLENINLAHQRFNPNQPSGQASSVVQIQPQVVSSLKELLKQKNSNQSLFALEMVNQSQNKDTCATTMDMQLQQQQQDQQIHYQQQQQRSVVDQQNSNNTNIPFVLRPQHKRRTFKRSSMHKQTNKEIPKFNSNLNSISKSLFNNLNLIDSNFTPKNGNKLAQQMSLNILNESLENQQIYQAKEQTPESSRKRIISFKQIEPALSDPNLPPSSQKQITHNIEEALLPQQQQMEKIDSNLLANDDMTKKSHLRGEGCIGTNGIKEGVSNITKQTSLQVDQNDENIFIDGQLTLASINSNKQVGGNGDLSSQKSQQLHNTNSCSNQNALQKQQQQTQSFFFYQFDCMKLWNIYYKHNNYDNVLANINKLSITPVLTVMLNSKHFKQKQAIEQLKNSSKNKISKAFKSIKRAPNPMIGNKYLTSVNLEASNNNVSYNESIVQLSKQNEN